MANAVKDGNNVSTIIGVSTSDFKTPTTIAVDPATHQLQTNATGGSGGAVTVADGADVTLGAKADAKSTATDTTAISAMSVLKQISASVQAPPSQAVTNAGIFAVQADTELPAASALADGEANPTTSRLGAMAMGFDGVSLWYRVVADNASGDAKAASQVGYVGNARSFVFNGTTWDRQQGRVKDQQAAVASFTITLASLASSTAGVGRQATLVDNTTNLYTAAKVYLKIKMGTTPTINSLVYVYLIQYDNSAVADDSAGATDAALTVINAPLLGTILCNATTTGATYTGIFDTSKVVDSLGPKWTIAVVNSTGVALDSTEGNHTKNYIGFNRKII